MVKNNQKNNQMKKNKNENKSKVKNLNKKNKDFLILNIYLIFLII